MSKTKNTNAIALVNHNDQQLAIDSHLDDLTKDYVQSSLSDSTRLAYKHDWKVFSEWCASKNVSSLPTSPVTVANFLSAQSKTYAVNKNGDVIKRNGKPAFLTIATLERRLAAIKLRHESIHLESPTTDKLVQATIRGIRRASQMPVVKKAPLTADRIESLIAQCPDTLTGLRDKALILLGFAMAARRSELVVLTVADIIPTPEGLKVTIRRSKTDQVGTGATIAVPNGTKFRIAETLDAWLKAANITEGAIFRGITKWGKIKETALTGKSVGCIVKQYASKAGLTVSDFGAHSLRSGFLTSAAANGASVFK